MSSSMKLIDEFLALKRIAIVGVSNNAKDFSRMLFREFVTRGYDVVPVNPKAREIEGKRSYANLQQIPEPVEGALLMTPPAVNERIVHDAAGAGIQRIWIYRTSKEAVAFCHNADISVVAGECPFMFLPGGAWVHRLHGTILKIAGTYPR
jgi:uncharacterized protein